MRRPARPRDSPGGPPAAPRSRSSARPPAWPCSSASVVVLARLLAPRDYGLLAMVLVVVGIGEIFRDFGLTNAVLRAPTLTQAEQRGLFWVSTAIGLGLTAVVFAAAPLVAAVFGQPPLTAMTRVLSSTFLINGLSAQYRADLIRRLRFGRVALADVAGQAVGLGVAIALAAGGAGRFALVAQQLVQLTVVLVLVAVFAGWLPGVPRRHSGVGRLPPPRLESRGDDARLLHRQQHRHDHHRPALPVGRPRPLQPCLPAAHDAVEPAARAGHRRRPAGVRPARRRPRPLGRIPQARTAGLRLHRRPGHGGRRRRVRPDRGGPARVRTGPASRRSSRCSRSPRRARRWPTSVSGSTSRAGWPRSCSATPS